MAGADVAACVSGQRGHARAISACVTARKAATPAQLCTQFDVLIGGHQPLQLYAVVTVLRAQQGLIRQGVVDKVPSVRVLRVEVTHAREESALSLIHIS